jgi:hypothetical protein
VRSPSQHGAAIRRQGHRTPLDDTVGRRRRSSGLERATAPQQRRAERRPVGRSASSAERRVPLDHPASATARRQRTQRTALRARCSMPFGVRPDVPAVMAFPGGLLRSVATARPHHRAVGVGERRLTIESAASGVAHRERSATWRAAGVIERHGVAEWRPVERPRATAGTLPTPQGRAARSDPLVSETL